ncbi:MAG: Rrf2 family transcriptional regulator [Verrucomicrobia bacterium]|nr:Rrf2 family transcriptional regulator [Verrucomicrobiota bacterium]
MKLSKKGEYALRALLDLTMAQALDRALVPLSALAEAQKMPATFLEQILAELRHAGFLSSTRGKYGGYSLARPASKIHIGEIVRLIDGPLAPIGCASVTAYERCSCPDEAHCGLRLIMMDVRNAISNVLDRYTLAQLAEVTLQHLRRDGLVPKVVELVRHLDLSTRAKVAAKTPPPPMEPEFCI